MKFLVKARKALGKTSASRKFPRLEFEVDVGTKGELITLLNEEYQDVSDVTIYQEIHLLTASTDFGRRVVYGDRLEDLFV